MKEDNLEELDELEETDAEDLSEEQESEEVSEQTEGDNKNTKKVVVELLPLPTKEEIIAQVDSVVIDATLPLETRVNQCRFKEELQEQIQDINFDDLIVNCMFSGEPEQAKTYEKLQAEIKKLLDKLPSKANFIDSEFSRRKNSVEAENRKRQEAAKPKKKVESPKDKKYKYPFTIHFAGHNIETDHIFENDKEYTENEITKKMLEHQYYEFAGSVSYTYMNKENVLLPIFQQYKKG